MSSIQFPTFEKTRRRGSQSQRLSLSQRGEPTNKLSPVPREALWLRRIELPSHIERVAPRARAQQASARRAEVKSRICGSRRKKGASVLCANLFGRKIQRYAFPWFLQLPCLAARQAPRRPGDVNVVVY